MSKKLRFRYATMGSGKSSEIIQVDFNYRKTEKRTDYSWFPIKI